MRITNQKPVVLSPGYKDTIVQAFDPVGLVKDVIAKPLFTPVIATQPVTMQSGGTAIDEDTIAHTVIDCCQELFNAAAETTAKEILGQTLVHFDKNTNLSVNELFPLQSAKAANLPEPSNTCVYTPSQDVIPTAKKFLSGICDYDTFFASLAFYARPNTLGFYFANEIAFNDFKAWLATQMTMLGNILPPVTNKLVSDFQNLQLSGLTESLLLRHDDSENNEPSSFARTIVSMLMTYISVVSPAEFGPLPFVLAELFCPKTVVFVNVEKHSKASAKTINDEWNLVNKSIQNKPAMISNGQLTKLTATMRNLQKIAGAAQQLNQPIAKAAVMRFSKTRPTTIDMTRIVKKIVNKMGFVNKSQNVYKSVKSSFARPNRRDPDDFNKSGKMVSTKYKPDLHLYIDTSGSISERHYQDAIKACIAMAKKMNINLYFNSFSHVLSQTTKLRLENKSKSAIYREFQKVAKVTGGTNYEQIWHFINSSPKRTRELSIVITDFQYTAPTQFNKHPKNLYYIPCSNMDWDRILSDVEGFAKSMLHNDPMIRKHILF